MQCSSRKIGKPCNPIPRHASGETETPTPTLNEMRDGIESRSGRAFRRGNKWIACEQPETGAPAAITYHYMILAAETSRNPMIEGVSKAEMCSIWALAVGTYLGMSIAAATLS